MNGKAKKRELTSLEKHSDVIEMLWEVETCLNAIAKSLAICGNSTLSENIYDLSNMIKNANELNREAFNDISNELLKMQKIPPITPSWLQWRE